MDNKALLIVHVQEGMFIDSMAVYNGDLVLQNIRKLIDKAHLAGVPVLYIQYTSDHNPKFMKDSEGWKIHHDIQPIDGDVILSNHTPDPFVSTSLNSILQEKGVTELVICGLQTENSIDTTCRRAFSLGYKNYLVKDANSTYDLEPLSAEQIIEHHHRIMAEWFATIVSTSDCIF